MPYADSEKALLYQQKTSVERYEQQQTASRDRDSCPVTPVNMFRVSGGASNRSGAVSPTKSENVLDTIDNDKSVRDMAQVNQLASKNVPANINVGGVTQTRSPTNHQQPNQLKKNILRLDLAKLKKY